MTAGLHDHGGWLQRQTVSYKSQLITPPIQQLMMERPQKSRSTAEKYYEAEPAAAERLMITTGSPPCAGLRHRQRITAAIRMISPTASSIQPEPVHRTASPASIPSGTSFFIIYSKHCYPESLPAQTFPFFAISNFIHQPLLYKKCFLPVLPRSDQETLALYRIRVLKCIGRGFIPQDGEPSHP